MPFRFRKRMKLGPFNFNLCRRGVGVSTGWTGFSIGRTNRGNMYISFGIPGTGISFYKEFGCEKGPRHSD